jgi:hypothetical protein
VRNGKLEAHHWGSDALDEAMILLEDIVDVLDLQDINRLARAGELEVDGLCRKLLVGFRPFGYCSLVRRLREIAGKGFRSD